MFKTDRIIRNTIARKLSQAANVVCKQHSPTITQEHQLSARLGQKLEDVLNGRTVGGYFINVITQDIPDRGPNSLESKIGADLYIGIRLSRPGFEISKGFLVQSKWDGPNSNADMLKTVDQCKKMMMSSERGSFIWTYGNNGIDVLPASEVIGQTRGQLQNLNSRKLGPFFKDVLDCFLGDPSLAKAHIVSDRQKLGAFLEELDVNHGIGIEIAAKE